MRCPRCQQEVGEHANFCSLCGTNLAKHRETSANKKNPYNDAPKKFIKKTFVDATFIKEAFEEETFDARPCFEREGAETRDTSEDVRRQDVQRSSFWTRVKGKLFKNATQESSSVRAVVVPEGTESIDKLTLKG